MPITSDIYCSHARAADGFVSAQASASYAPDLSVHPTHMAIHINVSLLHRSMEGQVSIRFHATTFVAKPHVVLNAVDFQSVHVASDDEMTWHYDGSEIHIVWKTEFQRDEERTATITYHVSKPISGLFFSDATGGDAWAVTDHETERCRYWLPCVDFPAARTTLEFHITHPKGTTALANGAFAGHTVGKDAHVTKYKLYYPCPSYLICWAVGNFTAYDDGEVDGIPVKYFAARSVSQDMLHRSFDKTKDMIRWLPKKLGVPFPWPKYYQLALPGVGGAMENISLVTWTDNILLDEKLAPELKELVVDMTNIHEMAHTYFGDMLVIRHFEHAWLKESWATYMETVYAEEHMSHDVFQFLLLLEAESYKAECKEYTRPIVTRVYDSSWDMFDRHTYPGGAWRLHMLRHILGDTDFWAAVKAYIVTYQKKTVETDNFRHELERVSGLNLTRFFDQWIYGKGYPKLTANWTYDLVKNTVHLDFEQTQFDDKQGIGYFDFSLQVVLHDDQGERYFSTVDFKEATKGRGAAIFKLGAGRRITQVLVDPDQKVLFDLTLLHANAEILLSTAEHAQDPISRIRAYSWLINDLGSDAVVRRVSKLVAKEPFWGVRRKAAEALAKRNTRYAMDALAALLEREHDPLALHATLLTCSAVKDPAIRRATLHHLRQDKLGYRAHSNALKVLARQRHPDDETYLLEAAQDPKRIGLHAIVRLGALTALGTYKSPKAFAYLLSVVGQHLSHEPVRARSIAVRALAAAARWQEEHERLKAVEAIADHLTHERETVRNAAISSLCSLDATAYKAKMLAVLATFPKQEIPALKKTIDGMGKKPSDKFVELEKTVDALVLQARELDAQLNALQTK